MVKRSVAGLGYTLRPGMAWLAKVAETTLNVVALVTVPPGVTTRMKPFTLPVPLGTTNVMLVAETTVKLVTVNTPMLTAVAPVKLVPVMVTVVPGPPVVGVKLVMVGAGGAVTIKFKPLDVPAELVTVTGKLPTVASALAGMVTTNEVALLLVWA